MTRVPTISQYPVDQRLQLVVIWNRLDVFDESTIEYYTFEKQWQPVFATNAHVPIPPSIVHLLYQWYHDTLLSEWNFFWLYGTALMHLKGSASLSLCWRWTRYMSLLVQAPTPAICITNGGYTRNISIPCCSMITFGGDLEPPWCHW